MINLEYRDFDFNKHDIGDDVNGKKKDLGNTSSDLKAIIGIHNVLIIKLEKI